MSLSNETAKAAREDFKVKWTQFYTFTTCTPEFVQIETRRNSNRKSSGVLEVHKRIISVDSAFGSGSEREAG